jgi:hypothetical protein
MATTEAGGGVPQELRLQQRLVGIVWESPIPLAGDDVEGLVAMLLAEIEAAGYELVPRERWRGCLADLCHEWGICEELEAFEGEETE